jgi:hypothetical protein
MINCKKYRFKSLQDSDSDYDYWIKRPVIERFRAIELLRQRYIELFYHGSEQRLQRVYRFVKRKRC